MTDTSTPHFARARRSLTRRCMRVGVLTLLGVIALAIVLFWLLTRSWFIVGRITPELERRLGGQVTIADASYQLNGAFVVEDFVIRTDTYPGTAGEIARIGRAIVKVDRRALMTGEVKIESIVLHGVLLRISEDMNDPGTFSFAALHTEWTDDDAERAMPPRIEIHDAVLEYGTFAGREYTREGVRRVAGVMHPAADDEHWYNFQLAELGDGADDGLLIHGRWNVMSHEYAARMEGLRLNEATYNMCPQIVQTWWDHMDLEGRLAESTVRWTPESGLQVASKILDVGLTLPVEAGEWARYHDGRIVGMSGRQRMRVHSGSIVLQDDQLKLDSLIGEIKSPDDATAVPYTVTMTLPQLPDLDFQREAWASDLMEHMPFSVSFTLPEFHLAADDDTGVAAIDLPLRVAEILERFQITDWTLATSIEVQREASRVDETGRRQPQPIQTTGELRITDASGSFERFRYPLDDVDAYLTFGKDRVEVRYVTGTAPNGVFVRLSGEITPLGRDPRIDLQLVANDVPIDDLLRDALPSDHMAVFDGLMHEPSERKLRRAGLLRNQEDVEQLRRRAGELDDLLAATDDVEQASAIERELLQVQAMVEAGAFEMGGRVDLNVNILRPYGPDQPTLLSGEVTVRRLDAIIQYFPYPFTIRGGLIRWHPDGAELVGDESGRGMPVMTQGGGRGYISGGFARQQFDDERDHITPEIEIEVDDDLVSELVYAAIPAPRDDEADVVEHGGITYSPAAGLLRGIGLSGTMDYTGRIHSDDTGRVGYEFHVHMKGGTAAPSDDLAEAIGSAGLVWPSEWTWDDVQVDVRISPQAVELVGFSGRRDDGRVSASGVIDLRSERADASLDVRFADLALDRYLVDLVPPEQIDAVQRWWDRYEPSGRFNAKLQYHRRGDTTHSPRLYLEPERATVRIGDERVTFQRRSGGMTVRSGAVVFDGLQLEIARDDASDGLVRLDGSIDASGQHNVMSMQARAEQMQVQSPVVSELLQLLGAKRQAQQLGELQASGVFNAALTYDANGEDVPMYEVKLLPKTFSGVHEGQAFSVRLDDPSTVLFRPGMIELDDVAGSHDDGEFSVTGAIQTGGLLRGSLEFSHVGSLAGEVPSQILPEPVRKAVQDLGYEDGPRTRVEDARLRFAQNGDGEAWHVDFAGKVHLDGAALTSGLDVSELDGVFDVALNMEPGKPLALTVDAEVSRMRVMKRLLTNVRVPGIHLSEDGRRIVIHELRADAYGGAVWADAVLGVGEEGAYTANLNVVGVSLREALADMSDDAEQVLRRGPRGELYGALQLTGVRGQPELRSGRGSVRAMGGALANVPLMLQMAQLVQFTVPLRGDLDHADVVFYIDGDRAVFERILLESTVGSTAALQLFGTGEMNLKSLELQTQFRSRSGMLLIRDLVGGLSDQLFTIEVTGTLADPRARVVPLPGLTQPDRSRQPSSAAAQRDLSR